MKDKKISCKHNRDKQNLFLKFNEELNDIPIHACYLCERLCFLKQCTILNNILQKQIHLILNCEFPTCLEKCLYVCKHCLKMIKMNKIPIFYVPNNIFRNIRIESVNKLNVLEERLIYPQQAFAQIYKLHNYGQYKLHGSVINVSSNLDKVQFILPRLLENDTTIGVVIKRRLQYKSPFMSSNVRPNMIMLALKDLLHTPLYKSLNIKIHHAWDSLFAIHMNTKTQHNCIDENDILKDNFEECFEDISTETMIHNFLDSDIINDCDKMLIVAPSEDYHPISIFKDKYSEELNFSTLFYGYPRNQNIYDNFSYHAIAK